MISRPAGSRRPTTIGHQAAPPALSVESTIAPTSGDSFACLAHSFPRVGNNNFLKHDGKVGGWTCADIPIMKEDRWVAFDVRSGHKYLFTGQPAEDYPNVPGVPIRTRAELGVHMDQNYWPIVEGQRQDPVKAYIALDFIRLIDGSLCRYDAFNKTGQRALLGLSSTITWQRGTHGEAAKAVVVFGSKFWRSGTREIFIPTFEITAWLVPDNAGGMRFETDADRPTASEQLNDRVPW
jgi:hypothetical protein